MNNYHKSGEVVTLTAPEGGVTKGLGYQIGSLFVVAVASVAAALPFEGMTVGVFDLVKNSGETWTEGELIYWDDTAKECTESDADEENMLIGCAVAAAGSSDVIGRVRLNGVAMPLLYEES